MTVCWIVVQVFGLKIEELFATILVFGLFYIHVFILDMLIQQISVVDWSDELFWALDVLGLDWFKHQFSQYHL
jgi:hypothetical protein